MDTNELSTQTYNGILIAAEKFHHDLTLQFGVLASECNDDDDYLKKAETMIRGWQKSNDRYIIENIFFGERCDLIGLRKKLNELLLNIEEIRKIPMNKRTYDVW